MDIPTSNIAAHMPVLEEYARNCRGLLEIGAEHGTGSTHAFRCGFEANSDPGFWLTVDWKNQIDPWCRPRFPFWHLLLGDSRLKDTEREAEIIVGGCLADLIFIDTDHTYEQMKAELFVWRRLAASDCVWLFHDTWMQGNYNHMTDAIKEFADQERHWVYRDLSTECHGLGALEPRK